MTSSSRNRRSIRLPGYDYAAPGAYFVTICTAGKECLLGDVSEGDMALSDAGRVAAYCWEALPRHFGRLELDAFVVMPNHVHGILILRDGDVGATQPDHDGCRPTDVRAPNASSLALAASPPSPNGTRPGSVGAIVQNFKAVSTRKLNRMRALPGVRFWQRDYYDHVVRDDAELRRIREYIARNPLRWERDSLYVPSAPP